MGAGNCIGYGMSVSDAFQIYIFFMNAILAIRLLKYTVYDKFFSGEVSVFISLFRDFCSSIIYI